MCVVKHVVAVKPQIGGGEINLSYVDSLKVGQINISPVPHYEFELKPLGYIDDNCQECTGQNIDDQVDSRRVAGNNENLISGIISKISQFGSCQLYQTSNGQLGLKKLCKVFPIYSNETLLCKVLVFTVLSTQIEQFCHQQVAGSKLGGE